MQNANIANLICIETFSKHIDRIQSANIINYIFLLTFDLTWILKSNEKFALDVLDKCILHSLYLRYWSDVWKKSFIVNIYYANLNRS